MFEFLPVESVYITTVLEVKEDEIVEECLNVNEAVCVATVNCYSNMEC